MTSANFTRYAKSSARVVITTGIQNSTRKITECYKCQTARYRIFLKRLYRATLFGCSDSNRSLCQIKIFVI